MLFKQTLVVAAVTAFLSGAALADTINIGSVPGSDTFTATEITFTNPGNTGPIIGAYWSAFGSGCGSCINWSPLTLTAGGGTEVLTIQVGSIIDTIDLTSYTFSGTADNLTVTGFGTSQFTGGPLVNIVFALTTQVTPGNEGLPTSYSGSISTPLPPAWTMLIASLLGLGFMAYRGSKKQSQALSMA